MNRRLQGHQDERRGKWQQRQLKCGRMLKCDPDGGDAMQKIVDDRNEGRNTRLLQFIRIERAKADALQNAHVSHPQNRPHGNARLVAFCRIARGRVA